MLSKPMSRPSGPVLCVEDDALTRQVLVRLLKGRFEQVLVAQDGQEGLDLFRLHRPALVVTDIKMPRMDGIAMAREIRLLAPATPIVVITSYDAADLLMASDSAMRFSKRRGGNAIHFYKPEMNARAQHPLVLENTLRRSFKDGDFTVQFQPQYDLVSKELKGFEALVRWVHPELGLIMPSDFIPLAEQTGLILQLGEWVLENACREGRAWMARSGRPVRMVVNVSGRQFWQGDLIKTVSRVLARTGFPAAQLELELIETMVMQDVEQAIATMHALAAMGIRLSIDDFGTGYSSLAALQQFPIHALKIEKPFIKRVASDPNDQAIAKVIIVLAHAMNLEVIAEGIEHADQLACLREDMGCTQGQGYLFGPPVDSQDAEALFVECRGRWSDQRAAS